MKHILLFAALCCAAFGFEPKDPVWSVLIKTENGTVSLLRNLNLADAVKADEALETHYPSGFWHTVQSSDIKEHKILGPDEWDGCRKSMAHKFILIEEVCDGGPNKGLKFKSGKCELCGEFKFEWIDKPRN